VTVFAEWLLRVRDGDSKQRFDSGNLHRVMSLKEACDATDKLIELGYMVFADDGDAIWLEMELENPRPFGTPPADNGGADGDVLPGLPDGPTLQ